MTNEENEWQDSCRMLGCVVCWLQGHPGTPAAIHHLIEGGRKISELHTIPLCEPGHHQKGDGEIKISRHPTHARFTAAYGTDEELLEATQQLVAKMRECIA
jgi:hypothetical protein